MYTDMRGIMRFMLRIMLACYAATCCVVGDLHQQPGQGGGDERDEKTAPGPGTSLQHPPS